MPAMLDRLRQQRAKERASGLGDMVRAEGDRLIKARNAFEHAAACYWSLIPDPMRTLGTPTRFARGTLYVKASSAAARHVLRRWIAAGGDRLLSKGGAGIAETRINL